MVSQNSSDSGNPASLEKILTDASRESISRAIRIHMALDLPMVEWRNGQIEWVQPQDERLKEILTEYSKN